MKLFKRMTGLVLAAVLVVTGCLSGIGSIKAEAEEIVEIYSEADWNDFADRVNYGETDLSAILMDDIYASEDIVQIEEGYEGSFDGNGHTVWDLTITLFDWVNGGSVSDLTVKNADIEVTGFASAGAIVNDLTDGGTVINCVAYGSVNVADEKWIGGIAGYINGGVVSDCVNYADVSGYQEVGGIVGYIVDGTVYNCINKGNVQIEGQIAGGIAGNTYPDPSCEVIMYNCINEGNVSGEEYIGGITGQILTEESDVTIHSVYNLGTVSGNRTVGGIAGMVIVDASGDTISIANGYNKGSVSVSRNNAGGLYGKVIGPENSIESLSMYYAKDDTLNNGIYSTGTNKASNPQLTSDYFGAAYTVDEFENGYAGYKLNSYAGFNPRWTKWALEDSELVFAVDGKNPVYRVAYMNDGSEYAVYYTDDTGSFEALDCPGEIDGAVFAGWFTRSYGVVDSVSSSIMRYAANLNAPAKANMSLYPVYVSFGTVSADPADDVSPADDGSGFCLQGVQIREADSSTGTTAGLRFVTKISTSFISSIEALNPANVLLKPESKYETGIGYGTVVTNLKNLSEGQMLVKNYEKAGITGKTVVSPAVNTYREYDGYILYTAMVVDIPESRLATDIAARPYVTYIDANGVERTYYYTEQTSSSVAGGAYYTSYQTVYNYLNGAN